MGHNLLKRSFTELNCYGLKGKKAAAGSVSDIRLGATELEPQCFIHYGHTGNTKCGEI